jgi:hypothetical protein
MMTPSGTVLMRLVPAGTKTGVEQMPTYDVLPAVLAKRRKNRGLEGIAAASDGILYCHHAASGEQSEPGRRRRERQRATRGDQFERAVQFRTTTFDSTVSLSHSRSAEQCHSQ